MHMTPSLTERFHRWRQPEGLSPDWHSANKVSIYHGEAERISRFVMAYPNLETGGDLFGFWTNSGAPVVSYAIGPGRYSTHCYARFYQDAKWLHDAGVGLYDRHGLQHIGEWHSHHQLGLNQPSAGDIRTVVRGMEAKNWPKFVLMIATRDATAGSPVVQSYYLVNPDGGYKPLRPRALPGGSPFRTGPNDPREEPFHGPAANREPLRGAPQRSGARARQGAMLDDSRCDGPTQRATEPMPPARTATPTHTPAAGPVVRPEHEREQHAVRAATREARCNLADRPNSGPVPHHGGLGGTATRNERSTP